jgi:hypothetical protein
MMFGNKYSHDKGLGMPTHMEQFTCSQRRKNSLFSLERMVSGLLHPLHMTYSSKRVQLQNKKEV